MSHDKYQSLPRVSRAPKVGSLRAGRLWACVTVAVVALLSLGAGAAPPKQGALGLADGRFWDDPAKLEQRALNRLDGTDFVGLFLDGPKRVLLRQHDSVPLVGVRASTIRDNATIALRRRAVIVSTRLEGNETLAATAFRQPDEKRDRSPPRDPASLPKGRTVKAFTIPLDQRISEVVSQPGTWSTTLLLFDQRSNSVLTQVRASPSKDVGKSHGAERGYPFQISPPVGAPNVSFRTQPDCPPIPRQDAIVLSSPGVAAKSHGRSLIVRGSYLLPVAPWDIVRPLPGPTGSAAESKARKAGWQDVGAPDAVAVLPMTLLLTGDDDATPIVLHLHIPVFQRLERSRGRTRARGQFSIDLLALMPEQFRQQNYALWALAGSQLSNPIVVQVTRP